MNNQKYIISILLFLIFILLVFVVFLLFDKNPSSQKTTLNNTKKEKQDIKIPEQKNKRLASQPEVYLGKNLKTPTNEGCRFIENKYSGKNLDQKTIKEGLTKEIKTVLGPYIEDSWTFNQVCRSGDFVVAYSMYSEERAKKDLSNNFIVAFVENEISLSYFLDEKINKATTVSEKCEIYELSKKYLKFKCKDDTTENKYLLPFSQDKRLSKIN